MIERQRETIGLHRRLALIIAQIRLAASFLTILPLGDDSSTPAEVAASFGWFPLIGFAIGVALLCLNHLLALVITGSVRAVLIVLALALITGAVHLDGLADTADALGAGRDRTRALTIMRDSRIGSFGVVAVFFVLAIKVAVLASATSRAQCLALYVAPGVARWAMVAMPYRLSYLRPRGAGSALLGTLDKRNLRVATIIGLFALIPAIGGAALRGAVAAAIVVWMLRRFYRRWLGGVTGDLIGAAGELVEAAAMIAIAA